MNGVNGDVGTGSNSVNSLRDGIILNYGVFSYLGGIRAARASGLQEAEVDTEWRSPSTLGGQVKILGRPIP